MADPAYSVSTSQRQQGSTARTRWKSVRRALVRLQGDMGRSGERCRYLHDVLVAPVEPVPLILRCWSPRMLATGCPLQDVGIQQEAGPRPPPPGSSPPVVKLHVRPGKRGPGPVGGPVVMVAATSSQGEGAVALGGGPHVARQCRPREREEEPGLPVTPPRLPIPSRRPAEGKWIARTQQGFRDTAPKTPGRDRNRDSGHSFGVGGGVVPDLQLGGIPPGFGAGRSQVDAGEGAGGSSGPVAASSPSRRRLTPGTFPLRPPQVVGS